MLIELKEDIFQTDNLSNLKGVIWMTTFKGRYELFADITKIGDNLDILESADQDVLNERFERWVHEGNPIPEIVVSDSGSPDHFTLEEAIAYLNQPYKILLENSDNDAYFLEALCRNFKKRSRKITRFRENLFLEYANAGGKSNIRHFVESELKKYGHLPKSPENYLRLFILVDSDSEYENDEKPEVSSLKSYLDTLKVPYHVLTKREMENYLPDEAFAIIGGNQAFIQAYLRLEPEQKDFFDLERGFPNRRRSQVEAEKGEPFQHLYQAVSDNDWRVFRNGDMDLNNFKNEFARFFECEYVTQETLQNRVAHQANPDELKDILEVITRHL